AAHGVSVLTARTVERAMRRRRDISCAEIDVALSRIISRAWRIVIRSAGIDRSLAWTKERPDQANGGDRHCTKLSGRDHSVTGGGIISESGAPSIGITKR